METNRNVPINRFCRCWVLTEKSWISRIFSSRFSSTSKVLFSFCKSKTNHRYNANINRQIPTPNKKKKNAGHNSIYVKFMQMPFETGRQTKTPFIAYFSLFEQIIIPLFWMTCLYTHLFIYGNLFNFNFIFLPWIFVILCPFWPVCLRVCEWVSHTKKIFCF